MNIKKMIIDLKSKLLGILKNTEIKEIQKNQFNNTNKFNEKLKREYSKKDNEPELVDIELLNRVINENLKQRRSNAYYNLLRIISEKMATQIYIGNRQNEEYKKSLAPEETKRIALQFFKNIDEEFYQKAKDIVEGNSEIEFRMYKAKDIKDFSEVEEDGLPKYSKVACVNGNKNRSVMYVPLQENVHDIFILVHELSHTFDLNRENEDINGTRNLLGEVTPSCFESMLPKYLLENKIVNECDIARMEKGMFISKYDDSVETFAKIMLMEIKKKKGNIKLEDIRSIQEKYMLSNDTIKFISKRLLNSPKNVDYRARYMMAQLIVPYCVEQYEENPKEFIERLKKYFEQVKTDNFSGALKSIGVTLESKSLDSFIRLNNKKIHSLQTYIEKVNSTNR